MPIFATEGQFSRFSSLVKWLADVQKTELHKDLVTVNDAAGATYTLGTVLGKVTATGKFVVSKQNAADGSQVPVAVYIADKFGACTDSVIAPATDTKVLILARGKAILALEGLKLDASFGTAVQKQFAYDSLKAVGLLVEASN